MAPSSPDPVVLAVWPWRQRMGPQPAAKASHGSARTVAIQTLVAAGVAGLFYWKHHFLFAAIVASVAGTLAACSLVWPAGYQSIQRGFQWLGVWLGRILTYVLLVPCFFLIFGTAHLFLLLFRRDLLGFRYHREQTTYWEDRAPVTDPARHLEVPY